MLNWYQTESGVACMVNDVQWSITFGSGQFFTVICGRTTIKVFTDTTLADVKKWVEGNV